jgi:hypothetical protein
MAKRRKKTSSVDFFGNPIHYYPRSALVRTSPGRYYLNVPGHTIDLNRVPPGFTVMGDGSLRRAPRKRRAGHWKTR